MRRTHATNGVVLGVSVVRMEWRLCVERDEAMRGARPSEGRQRVSDGRKRFLLVDAEAAAEGRRAMTAGAEVCRQMGRIEDAVIAERAARALTPQPEGTAVEVETGTLVLHDKSEEFQHGALEMAVVLKLSLADEYDRISDERDALRAEVARVREPPCSCCIGTGKPISGRPCICGGTGREEDETMGLRRLAHEQEAEIERLRRALTNAEADARVLAHAYEHDSRPPPAVVARAMAYDAGRRVA